MLVIKRLGAGKNVDFKMISIIVLMSGTFVTL